MILIEVAYKVTNYDGPAFKLDWLVEEEVSKDLIKLN